MLAHVRASKLTKEGASLIFRGRRSVQATMIVTCMIPLFEIRFDDERDVLTILNSIGHMPLPPYIDRPDEGSIKSFIKRSIMSVPGAVADTHSQLHFDEPLLEALRNKGVEMVFVTLHVGCWHFPACSWIISKNTLCIPVC